ncbi:MAG: 3-oxoadipate enol-lactonase [Anaerolineae bacterium]|nr:MAG: 3-oxoadipate enol-lactonase [Anaerolineae bacterium]
MPTFHTNGIDLYYETVGQGEPILLLHGLGSCAEDWALQIPALAQRYRVIAADMRGHGHSDKPHGPYSVAMMATDVLGLLDGLGIKSTHIIGLSMGGMIAFQLAVDHPDRVRSMVIVNSAPALVAQSFGEKLNIKQRLLLAQLFGPARTGRFLSKRLFPKPDQEFMRAQLIERWAKNDKDAYLASMRALIGWSVLDRVGSISCPVMVIAGDRDYTPLEAKRKYVALIPNAQLKVIEDSGHATPIDQADRFNACVLEFLSGVDGQANGQA